MGKTKGLERIEKRIFPFHAHTPLLHHFPLGGDTIIPIIDGGTSIFTGTRMRTIRLRGPLSKEGATAVIYHNIAHAYGNRRKIIETNAKLKPELQTRHTRGSIIR